MLRTNPQSLRQETSGRLRGLQAGQTPKVSDRRPRVDYGVFKLHLLFAGCSAGHTRSLVYLSKSQTSCRGPDQRHRTGPSSRPPRHDVRVQRLLSVQQRGHRRQERHRQPRPQEDSRRRLRRPPRPSHAAHLLRQLQGSPLRLFFIIISIIFINYENN